MVGWLLKKKKKKKKKKKFKTIFDFRYYLPVVVFSQHPAKSANVAVITNGSPATTNKTIIVSRMSRRQRSNSSDTASTSLTERNGLLIHRVHRDGAIAGSRSSGGILQILHGAFLPQRFPHSVSADYVAYQAFDSVQAIASNLTGTLATKSVLSGLGVGQADATVISATMSWLLRDGAGMLGRVIFAYLSGSALDCEAKTYRLLADVLNDAAILVDMTASMLPASLFLPAVCLSSVLRSVVGVAGAATKAAVSMHQARDNNVGDVLAKDSAQETAVGLVGLALSLFVVPLLGENVVAIWLFFALGTALHLVANYCAMSCVAFDTFNRQRFALCMDDDRVGRVQTPLQIATRERFLTPFRDAAFRRRRLDFGASLVAALRRASSPHQFDDVRSQLTSHRYAVIVGSDDDDISVCFASNAEPLDLLAAFFVARSLALGSERDIASARTAFDGFMKRCEAKRWRSDVALLNAAAWRVDSADHNNKAH
jgi:hypothetical protein